MLIIVVLDNSSLNDNTWLFSPDRVLRSSSQPSYIELLLTDFILSIIDGWKGEGREEHVGDTYDW